MTNIHPPTWVWLVEVISDRYDPIRVAVAADSADLATDIVFARYRDAKTATIIGNGMRLLTREDTALASRKAPSN